MTKQERDKQIIDLYLNHPELSNEDIANKFQLSKSTISRIARINNLPRRVGNSGIKISKQQEENIKQKYLNGTPLIILQKEYSISYDRIKNIVSSCQPVSSSKRLNPNLQENYFNKIDTAEKAYWLGWLISDGAITNNFEKSKFQIELTLKKEDESILHLLESDLGVVNKVYTSNINYKRFSLGCKQMVIDLNNLGIHSNKSFFVKVPVFPKEYNSAFLRGLFDGDGGFTVYTRANGKKCQELSFCGNENIIRWIQKTLFEEIPTLSKNSITKESSIKRIRWSSKKDIILLRDYLYKNHNNHYLERKYNLIYANTEVTNSITKGELVPQSVESE